MGESEKDHTFPTLYKRTTNGKINQWKIRVVQDSEPGIGSWIFILRGGMGEKQSEDQKLISIGKNIGRKNETTPWQQAYKEAKGKWTRKKDRESYTTNKGDAMTNINIMPMLAHKYKDHPNKMIFPCFIQPKLDGIRAIACPDSTLFSRRKMKYFWLDHIREDVSRMITGKEYLDGELYVNPNIMSQQNVSGLCRHKDEPDAEQLEKLKLVEYHVYDFFDLNHMDYSFEERWENLKNKFKQGTYKHIKLVETKELKDRENVQRLHDEYQNKGYEGMILRNKDGVYKLVYRSYDLMKYKMFDDIDCKIVDCYDGEGSAEGLAIWVVEMDNGKQFNVVPNGTEDERREWFENSTEYMGKTLIVKYKDMTEDGIPKIAKGIRFKDKGE